MRLSGKTALITGGSSGIGLATARLFVAEGAKVVITGRRQDALDYAVGLLGESGHAVRAEVTDPAGARAAAEAATGRFGRLDIVFGNAGVPGQTPVDSASADDFMRIIGINLLGPFLTVQAALPHLGAGAAIVLNGSVHQVLGIPGASAYAASKGGIGAMTRVLASELAPRGIRVNAVVPGATRTPIWAARATTADAKAALEARFNRMTPLNRFGEAEDIARAVLYLASDDAAHVTATELVVDGGATGAPAGAPIYR